ncbi:MAG: aminoglycoside 6-adenylyltransferase [Oscillospiraceae bacterium]|nr:aminoglycoside 6-adenylyltransferase [Oscillospiraceae bacterium]
MRSEREMLELIINTAKEDGRIRGVIMSGSRADVHAPRDIYQDYDIVYLVDEVTPFWNNTAWLEEKFGRILLLQTPEIMSLIPPDNDGSFVFLTIFEDGNRIDLCVTSKPYVDNGEPAIVLLDKTGELSGIKPREDFWYIKPPEEKLFHDCCNEFHWCLNNVAKGIARDELPYVMGMLNSPVRDALNIMTDWYIGAENDFKVSAGKMGKYYKKYLPEELYKMYAATYSDSDYDNIWNAVFTACELFRRLAESVAGKFGYTYNITEDENIIDYMNKVKNNILGD